MYNYQSTSKWYNLSLPDKWKFNLDDECLHLFNPEEGVGSIELSAYSFPDYQDVNPQKELYDYVLDKGFKIEYDSIIIEKDDVRITAKYSFKEKGRFWLVWIIVQNSKILFVTYNCDSNDIFMARDEVEKIVKSIIIN